MKIEKKTKSKRSNGKEGLFGFTKSPLVGDFDMFGDIGDNLKKERDFLLKALKNKGIVIEVNEFGQWYSEDSLESEIGIDAQCDRLFKETGIAFYNIASRFLCVLELAEQAFTKNYFEELAKLSLSLSGSSKMLVASMMEDNFSAGLARTAPATKVKCEKSKEKKEQCIIWAKEIKKECPHFSKKQIANKIYKNHCCDRAILTIYDYLKGVPL